MELQQQMCSFIGFIALHGVYCPAPHPHAPGTVFNRNKTRIAIYEDGW
jgi:hypothetical protein